MRLPRQPRTLPNFPSRFTVNSMFTLLQLVLREWGCWLCPPPKLRLFARRRM